MKIENKKKEYQEQLQKGYIIISKGNEKWMVCSDPLTNITAREILSKHNYSRCGYSDWQIGFITDYYLDIRKVYSSIKHYLGKEIAICKDGQYFASKYNDYYVFRWETYIRIKSNNVVFLDGVGDEYEYDIKNPKMVYYEKDDRMNALLVRKIQ